MYIMIISRKMVSIHEAAEFFGIATQTLRRWEREGKLTPDERMPPSPFVWPAQAHYFFSTSCIRIRPHVMRG